MCGLENLTPLLQPLIQRAFLSSRVLLLEKQKTIKTKETQGGLQKKEGEAREEKSWIDRTIRGEGWKRYPVLVLSRRAGWKRDERTGRGEREDLGRSRCQEPLGKSLSKLCFVKWGNEVFQVPRRFSIGGGRGD